MNLRRIFKKKTAQEEIESCIIRLTELVPYADGCGVKSININYDYDHYRHRVISATSFSGGQITEIIRKELTHIDNKNYKK